MLCSCLFARRTKQNVELVSLRIMFGMVGPRPAWGFQKIVSHLGRTPFWMKGCSFGAWAAIKLVYRITSLEVV